MKNYTVLDRPEVFAYVNHQLLGKEESVWLWGILGQRRHVLRDSVKVFALAAEMKAEPHFGMRAH